MAITLVQGYNDIIISSSSTTENITTALELIPAQTGSRIAVLGWQLYFPTVSATALIKLQTNDGTPVVLANFPLNAAARGSNVAIQEWVWRASSRDYWLQTPNTSKGKNLSIIASAGTLEMYGFIIYSYQPI